MNEFILLHYSFHCIFYNFFISNYRKKDISMMEKMEYTEVCFVYFSSLILSLLCANMHTHNFIRIAHYMFFPLLYKATEFSHSSRKKQSQEFQISNRLIA